MEYFKTEIGTLYNDDTLKLLKTLPSESIDTVITSPPYWGLRDYGIKGQLGLENTFQEYLKKLWTIFGEVRRILKPMGTLWVNLGDTYYGGGHGGNTKYYINNKAVKSKKQGEASNYVPTMQWSNSYPKKSLCLIPQRFAIGMIERGWILRNDIIWYKPNAMPSSAKDRFTVDYEHIFFFVKNKKYYFEQQIEPFAKATYKRIKYSYNLCKGNIQSSMKYTGSRKFQQNVLNGKLKGKNKRCIWEINTKPFKGEHFAVFPQKIPEICMKAGCPEGGIVLDPFMGSGTTAVVAEKLSRHWIGIELNQKYCKIAAARIEAVEMNSLFN